MSEVNKKDLIHPNRGRVRPCSVGPLPAVVCLLAVVASVVLATLDLRIPAGPAKHSALAELPTPAGFVGSVGSGRDRLTSASNVSHAHDTRAMSHDAGHLSARSEDGLWVEDCRLRGKEVLGTKEARVADQKFFRT